MKPFRYQAKKGMDLVKGILSAETRDAAIDKINEMGLVPVEVVEAGDSNPSQDVTTSDSLPQKISRRSLTLFFRQLGRLLKSGVPLLPALALTAEQTEDETFQTILEDIKKQVRGGRSLTDAMTRYTVAFNGFSIAMIDLGENTGHLDEALCRLAECYERQSQTLQRIRNALMYPAFVITLGAAALVFLLAYVVPKFSKLFDDLGQSLPLLTRILISLSNFAQQYGLGIILALAVLVFMIRASLRVPSHRMKWDRAKMTFPLLGKIIFMAQFTIFSRSIEMLLKGGVPLLKALRTALPAVSNMAMRENLLQVMKRVEQGATLSESLKTSGIFPIFAIHLLMIGEQTGRLEQSFGDIADWYDQEVGEHTRMMTQLIEPITILVLGLSLGFIAMAILLPVFSMDVMMS